MDGVLKGATEENVITVLCWNELHAGEVAYRITPQIFSLKHYKEIAEVAINFIERFGKPPRGHLVDLLEDKVRRGDKTAQFMRLTIDQMETVQADLNTEFVLGELDQFIRQQKMLEDLDKAMDLARGGQLDAAADTAVKASFRTSTKFSGGIRLNNTQQVLKLLEKPDEVDFFPSGVEALDQRSIRPAPKTLMMLMAPAKKGKSWWLVQVGKESILHRKNVLHITLENSEEMTALRYVQAVCSMTAYDTMSLKLQSIAREGSEVRFSFNSFSTDAVKMENRTRIESSLRAIEHRGQLIIKEFPTGSLTVAQVGAYIDYLANHEDFVPDVLILDYIDLMDIDSGNHRIDTGRVTRDLRGLCVQRNLAGVSVTQVNRVGSAEGRLVRATDVAEDWSKVATADIVLTYSQTQREREKRFARLFVAAARNATDQYIVLITQAYEIGQFCLDSMFFSNDVERAWKTELDPALTSD